MTAPAFAVRGAPNATGSDPAAVMRVLPPEAADPSEAADVEAVPDASATSAAPSAGQTGAFGTGAGEAALKGRAAGAGGCHTTPATDGVTGSGRGDHNGTCAEAVGVGAKADTPNTAVETAKAIRACL